MLELGPKVKILVKNRSKNYDVGRFGGHKLVFNPLNRRSYPLGAGCLDYRLIWGSVRRVRSIFGRKYVWFSGVVINRITMPGSTGPNINNLKLSK